MTPVQNCFIVDRATYVKQYKDRNTEIIKSKKLCDNQSNSSVSVKTGQRKGEFGVNQNRSYSSDAI